MDNEQLKNKYLVSNVIFLIIKDGKITDKQGTEIETDFVLSKQHFLTDGWGYVIL